MDVGRAIPAHVLEQVAKWLGELSDADLDRLGRGELRASFSLVEVATGKRLRRQRAAPVSGEAMREAYARLSYAGSREEGQRIVEEALEGKQNLLAFARYLDLPVRRKDTVQEIRDKVLAHTVERRLSGEAARRG